MSQDVSPGAQSPEAPGNPGDKVSLNPQPLPPKWLPSFLVPVYNWIRSLFRGR